MTETFSVPVAMVEAIEAFFADEGHDTLVWIGWHDQARTINQGPGGANRIVFDMNGTKAKTLPVRGGPGMRRTSEGDARTLHVTQYQIPVTFWAYDSTGDGEDDRLQIRALAVMFERCSQAIAQWAYANHLWTDRDWSSPPTERAFGRQMKATLLLDEVVRDVDFDRVVPEPHLDTDYVRLIG
jgi:hypothetical protein